MTEKLPETKVGLGTTLGIISAFGYTAAILALRYVARPDDHDWAMWISCLKAIPAGLVATVMMLVYTIRGENPWPSWKTAVVLFGTGLFMQFAGNVCFQIGLGIGGIGMTVPISFAAMIFAAASAGRIILGERITRRSFIAMVVLIGSIGVLSIGAGDFTTALKESSTSDLMLLGVVMSCVAGVGWALPGVVIRKLVSGDVRVTTSVFFLSNAGILGLGVVTWNRMGFSGMAETTPTEWAVMAAAGTFNAIAFYCLSHALRFISVLRANLLNASQIALAAIGGVFMFREPFTMWLGAGVAMTIVGLFLMERPK